MPTAKETFLVGNGSCLELAMFFETVVFFIAVLGAPGANCTAAGKRELCCVLQVNVILGVFLCLAVGLRMFADFIIIIDMFCKDC